MLRYRSYENESSDVILSRSGVERILVGVRAAQAKNLARSEVAGRGPVRFFAIAQNDMVLLRMTWCVCSGDPVFIVCGGPTGPWNARNDSQL